MNNKKKIPLLCRIGLHWPLKGHTFEFTDWVSGKAVNMTTCPCGRKWMTDTMSSYPFFKVEHEEYKPYHLPNEPKVLLSSEELDAEIGAILEEWEREND